MQLNCIAGKSRTAVIIFCKVIISPSENSQPVDVEKRRVVFFFFVFFCKLWEWKVAEGASSGCRTQHFCLTQSVSRLHPQPEQTAPSHSEKTPGLQPARPRWERTPSKWKALLVVSNTDTRHGKVHRIQMALQQRAAGHINSSRKKRGPRTITWGMARWQVYERRRRWRLICIKRPGPAVITSLSVESTGR